MDVCLYITCYWIVRDRFIRWYSVSNAFEWMVSEVTSVEAWLQKRIFACNAEFVGDHLLVIWMNSLANGRQGRCQGKNDLRSIREAWLDCTSTAKFVNRLWSKYLNDLGPIHPISHSDPNYPEFDFHPISPDWQRCKCDDECTTMTCCNWRDILGSHCRPDQLLNGVFWWHVTLVKESVRWWRMILLSSSLWWSELPHQVYQSDRNYTEWCNSDQITLTVINWPNTLLFYIGFQRTCTGWIEHWLNLVTAKKSFLYHVERGRMSRNDTWYRSFDPNFPTWLYFSTRRVHQRHAHDDTNFVK